MGEGVKVQGTQECTAKSTPGCSGYRVQGTASYGGMDVIAESGAQCEVDLWLLGLPGYIVSWYRPLKGPMRSGVHCEVDSWLLKVQGTGHMASW